MRNKVSVLGGMLLCGAVVIASATTFPGAGTGPIPDGPGVPTACGSDGDPLDITFTVAGEAPGAPVDVGVQLDVSHTWVTDVAVTLIAPDGTTSVPMFGRTKATTATACGDSSDLEGEYGFYDDTPNATNWWDEAANDPMTPGEYKATEMGGDGQVDPAPFVVIDDAFAGLADANGTWTLRVVDSGGGDTGEVRTATLFLGQPVPVELMSFSIE